MKHTYMPLLLSISIAFVVVLILITGPLLIVDIPFLLIQVFGWLLIGWALLAQKVNKTIHHNLPKDLFWVKKGPYEIIRHPIYTGMLFIMAGYVQGYPSLVRFLLFGLLVFIVILKVKTDEARMHDALKDYSEYQKRTHRLMPYLY